MRSFFLILLLLTAKISAEEDAASLRQMGLFVLRLAACSEDLVEKQQLEERGMEKLVQALALDPYDPSLYKTLIFLVHGEEDLVIHYLKMLLEKEVKIPAADAYFYVREAVAIGEYELGQKVLGSVQEEGKQSQLVASAREYLHQHGEGI